MLTDIERFKLLPQATQDAILDKHRDWNTEHDWWDGVYEQFLEKMKEAGIEVYTKTQRTAKGRTYEEPAIYFRGFWSQGDGACFEGRVLDWNLVLTMHDFPLLMQYREEFDTMQFSWRSSGNYCHEHTLSFEDEGSYPVFLTAYEDLPELRRIAVEQLHDELAKEWDRFKEHFEEVVKDYCRELYSDLEKDHDYLTEDEQILESLSANDILDELIKEYDEEHESA